MSDVAAPPRLGVAGDRVQSATRAVVVAFGLFGVVAFGGPFVALAGAGAHDKLVTHATEDKR
jgi:hypothetical protein